MGVPLRSGLHRRGIIGICLVVRDLSRAIWRQLAGEVGSRLLKDSEVSEVLWVLSRATSKNS